MAYTRRDVPVSVLAVPIIPIEPAVSEPEPVVQELIKAPPFIRSDEFVGSKPGYVFNRSNEYGLGYHLDNHPSNPLPPGFKP